MKSCITYSEKPVTADEKAIAEVLEKIVMAADNSDLDLFSSVFFDDATISMIFEEKQMSKTDFFKEISEKISTKWHIAYRDVVVRLKNENKANIYCSGSIKFVHSLLPVSFLRCLYFEKRFGIWKIIKAE